MHLSLELPANNKIGQKKGFQVRVPRLKNVEFESEMDETLLKIIKDNLRIGLMKI